MLRESARHRRAQRCAGRNPAAQGQADGDGLRLSQGGVGGERKKKAEKRESRKKRRKNRRKRKKKQKREDKNRFVPSRRSGPPFNDRKHNTIVTAPHGLLCCAATRLAVTPFRGSYLISPRKRERFHETLIRSPVRDAVAGANTHRGRRVGAVTAASAGGLRSEERR